MACARFKASPSGPVCHTGNDTCFGEANVPDGFLFELEQVIQDRKTNSPVESYTSELFASGLDRIAQKTGEQSVELIIAAMNADTDRLKSEAADLFYHLLVLLAYKDIRPQEIAETLKSRAKYSR